MKRAAATSSPSAASPKRAARQGDAYAQSSGIASLPTSALSLVWSYAVSMKTSDEVSANAEHQMIQMQTHDLQLVCRAWRENMQQILREKLRGVAIVDVVAAAKVPGSADGTTTPLVLTLESFDKASPVTDVRIVMGDLISGEDVNDRGIWMDGEQPLIAVRMQRNIAFHKTQPEIDWEATLKPHGDNITRLDLSHMPLYSHHLGALLRAAAKLCPNVKALLLPPAEKKMYRNEETRTDNMDALSGAMRAWHKSNGGLTHLRVPFVGLNNLVSSVLFVNDVTQYCPDIEHLDGWRFTFIEQANLEFVTCDDYWLSPPELFSRLWETCTKLKSFNTVVLPFGEEFYAELGEVDKPQLEELVLSYNSLTSNPSVEVDSELFLAIPERVPALRKLTVMYGQAEEEEWQASEVFDDAFFLEVAKQCPKLEKLSVKSFSDLEKLTTASLSALLSLEALSDVLIRGMGELSDDFVDLLAQRIQQKKELRLRLTATRVRDTIWKVLELVAGMKTDQFLGVSLSLSLKTPEAFGFVIAEGDDQNARLHEIEQVKELVETIKRTHGETVRVHLHVTEPSEEHDSKCVLFDSLELSINDPQGFCCTRAKYIECGMQTIDQELCGEDIRKDGVYERDADGVLEDKEIITYQVNKRGRQIFYPDLLSDEENDAFGEGSDDEEFDDGLVFVDGEDDDEGEFDEEDDEEEEGDDDDDGEGDDIFGNGEEDD